MKVVRRKIIFFFCAMMWLTACSQSGQSEVNLDHYKGSSPCDPLIKSMTGIPQAPICDFISWDLIMNRDSINSTFQVKIIYGESQPNTPGFKVDHHIEFEGNYQVRTGVPTNPRAKLYHLKSSKDAREVWLMELDRNIFLFADKDGKNLPGNAGYSYVLNRIKE